jgi:hypothetical protein
MTHDDLLEKLFPLPEGVKLRQPRFGNAGPSDPVELPPLGVQLSDTNAPRPPFQLSWADESLGLRVDILEDPNSQLFAYVTCTKPEHFGKAASVALVGTEDRLLRKTIPLADRGTYGGGHASFGKASFGKLEQVKEELGEKVQLSVYLLE